MAALGFRTTPLVFPQCKKKKVKLETLLVGEADTGCRYQKGVTCRDSLSGHRHDIGHRTSPPLCVNFISRQAYVCKRQPFDSPTF